MIYRSDNQQIMKLQLIKQRLVEEGLHVFGCMSEGWIYVSHPNIGRVRVDDSFNFNDVSRLINKTKKPKQ
jgi:hypothetical protein